MKSEEVRLRAYAELAAQMPATQAAAYAAALDAYTDILDNWGTASASERAAAEARLNTILRRPDVNLYDNYLSNGARIADAFDATPLQGTYVAQVREESPAITLINRPQTRDLAAEQAEMEARVARGEIQSFQIFNTPAFSGPLAYEFAMDTERTNIFNLNLGFNGRAMALAQEIGQDANFVNQRVHVVDERVNPPHDYGTMSLRDAFDQHPEFFGMTPAQGDRMAEIISMEAPARAALIAGGEAGFAPPARPTDIVDSMTLSSGGVETLSVQVQRDGHIEGLSSAAEVRSFLGELKNTMANGEIPPSAQRIIGALDATARATFRADLIADAAAQGVQANDPELVAALAVVDAQINPPAPAPSWGYGIANDGDRTVEAFERASVAALLTERFGITFTNNPPSLAEINAKLSELSDEVAAYNAANGAAADITLPAGGITNENFASVQTSLETLANVPTGVTFAANTDNSVPLRALGSDTVRALQNAIGMTGGEIDGDVGSRTIAAYVAFCQARGIPVDAANPVLNTDVIQAVAAVTNGEQAAQQDKVEATLIVAEAISVAGTTATEDRILGNIQGAIARGELTLSSDAMRELGELVTAVRANGEIGGAQLASARDEFIAAAVPNTADRATVSGRLFG